MHATMDDIARECGLSKKTVSRVFADSDAVKPATREKVLAAAKHLHYELNVMARNLTQNQAGFIGVATPFAALLGGSYFAEAIRGFRRGITDDSGFIFALFDTNSDAFNNGEKLAKLYRQRRVDGLLVVALHTHDRFLATLEKLHVPMVVVGEKPASPSTACSVYCDDERGISMLCSHLYSLGHRHIGFVGGPTEYSTAIRREQAYLRFMRSKKVKNVSGFVQQGDFSLRSGRTAVTALLQIRPRPTAIVAANDTMAFGVMEGIRALGLRIPEDVSVAGFDDDPSASEHAPSLTTIHQPIFEMSELSARKLFDAIGTGTVPTGIIQMEPTLVIRESTAPPNGSADQLRR